MKRENIEEVVAAAATPEVKLSNEKIIEVSEERVPVIEKLVKKANKLGAKVDLSIEHTGERLLKGTYTNKLIQLYTVTIKSVEMDIPDYNVLGKIEVTGIGNNLITSFCNSEFNREPYRDIDKIPCQHCNTNRKRKYLYVVQDKKTNELITMGRACLNDFLKLHNLEIYIKCLEVGFRLFDEIDEICEVDSDLEEFKEFQKKCKFLKIESVLGFVNKHLSTNEYISQSSYLESTVQKVGRELYEHDIVSLDDAVPDEFKKGIQEDIEFFLAHYDKLNDFHLILRNILEGNAYVERIKVNYLISFSKTVEYLRRKSEFQNKVVLSEYVGTVGEKINEKVIFNRETSYQTYYGGTYLYFFKLGNDTLVWKTSKYLEFTENKEYNLKATIKEHSVYNSEKQTYILRAKVEEV